MEFLEQKGAQTLPAGRQAKLNVNNEEVGCVITHGPVSGTVDVPAQKNGNLKAVSQASQAHNITGGPR
jgi:hypothetical protein